MSFSATSVARGARIVSIEHIESLKWFAAVAMLIEHYYRYVAGTLPEWAYVLGRTVFPLFALALGAALARCDRPTYQRAARRLAAWTVLTALLSTLARPWYPLPVLGTLLISALLYSVVRTGKGSSWDLAMIGPVASAVALPFEFGPFGAVGAALLMHSAGEGRHRWPALVGGLGLICVSNGDVAACLALIVVAGVQGADLAVPRVRHAFYWIYAAQFPIFALLSRMA